MKRRALLGVALGAGLFLMAANYQRFTVTGTELHIGGTFSAIVFDDPVTLPAGSWTLQQAYTAGDTITITAGNPIELSSATDAQRLIQYRNSAAAEVGYVDENGDALLYTLTTTDDLISGDRVVAGSSYATNAEGTIITGQGYFYRNATMDAWLGTGSEVMWSDNADGAAGSKVQTIAETVLTSATMTRGVAQSPPLTTAFAWTNAMVTALGAVTAGDVSVGTLPAKTVITNAYVVIGTSAGTVAVLNVSVGRTGANYDDYVVDSDAKAAANTVYGDAVGERGTNLTGYDLPSYTATTTVNAHFDAGAENLSTVTTSTGTVFVTYYLLP